MREVERRGGGGQRTVASPCGRGGLAASERKETTTPRQMIDTGIPWIGQVPEGWEVWRFVHAFEFAKGLNITKADLAQSGVPVVSYGQIHSKENVGTILLQSLLRYVSREIADSDIGASLSKGDIVFADTSEDYDGVGNCVRINDDTEVFAGYHTIVAKPRFREASHYLAYLFQTVPWRSQLARNVNGIKVFSITQKVFRDATILLPPLPTQRAIAAYLDGECGKIDALRTKIEAQIADLATYKKSVITEAVTGKVVVEREVEGRGGVGQWCVSPRSSKEMKPSGVEWIGDVPAGWKVSPLKYYLDILPGYAFSSSDFDTKGGVRLLRGVNVGVDTLRWDEVVYWNKPITEQIKPYVLELGDLIFGLDRPWISEGTRVAFVEKEDLPSLLLQRVCRIRSSAELLIKLVYYWLGSDAFERSLGAETTGISVPHISTNQISDFKVALPPLPEQREIAAYLDEKCAAIDAAVAKCREQLTDLASYKKSLIYECVTGKQEVA